MNLSLKEVLELTGGKFVRGNEVEVSGIAALNEAGSGDVSFLGNEKYYQDFLATRAGVVLLPAGVPEPYPAGVAIVEVENPTLAFNALVQHFAQAYRKPKTGIHATAVIDETAELGADVYVGPRAVVGANVKIGGGSQIMAGVVIYDGAVVGENCLIHANAVIREGCRLGDRVILQPNATIGSDGFGYQFEGGRHVAIDQLGIVELGDDVEIGANSCIDRARFGKTRIGEGSKIDNLVQIGHNCEVGKHCIIISQTGIAGSTRIGNYCTIAAQCGIAGHVKICDQVTMGARTGVISDITEKAIYWGSPCSPVGDARRQYAALRKLPDLLKEWNAIKKQFDLQ